MEVGDEASGVTYRDEEEGSAAGSDHLAKGLEADGGIFNGSGGRGGVRERKVDAGF